MRHCARHARLAVVLAVLAHADLHAQSLGDQCSGTATDVALCQSVAAAAVTLPSRFAIVAAGGNPVSGTASTLGMRMPGSPRWSLALRSTFARAPLPPMGTAASVTPTLWSIAADGAVGIYNGMQLLPTIGGFASLDVLASAGLVGAPASFDRSSPLTWSIGTRLGLLRESFTAPGVSVSAQYRSLPDVSHDSGTSMFDNTDQSVISVRGTIGKRILGLGLSGGAGWDRVRADVRAGFDPAGTGAVFVEDSDFESGRVVYFGGVSYTLLIVNMAAELGWQGSGERPAGTHGNTGKGGLFGGVAVRLAI